MRRSWVACLVGASLLGATAVGSAQPEPEPIEAPWTVGLSLTAGGMLSPDQRDLLHLGGIGGSARLSLLVRPLDALGIDWLEGGASLALTVIGSTSGPVGGVLDLQLAARAAPDVGGGVRPWIAVGVGPGWTGALTRPVGTVGVGLWIPVIDEVVVGPELWLLHVAQDDGPAYSDDALFLSGGLALAYRYVERPRPSPPEPAPEPISPPEPPPLSEPIAPARERRPLDEDLLFLVERAVPGSSLSVVLLVPPVIFEHGAHELTPAGEVSMHDVLERLAVADPEARVVIEGHADETGTPDYNVALSRRRAETVASWLTAHGVPAERMRITAEGALRPLVIGESIDALAPNRRVTIRIEVRLPPTNDETAPEAAADPSDAELAPGTTAPASPSEGP
jgi:outer membrane protein OmpA-like peptidoglycan-associated protein